MLFLFGTIMDDTTPLLLAVSITINHNYKLTMRSVTLLRYTIDLHSCAIDIVGWFGFAHAHTPKHTQTHNTSNNGWLSQHFKLDFSHNTPVCLCTQRERLV